MGWTTTPLRWGEKMTDYLKDNFTWESETHTHRVLASSLVRFHTWYAAVERIEKGSNSREVFAVVCLVHNHPRSGEFSYKDMSEDAGPCERECPEKILKLLTPTTNQHATRWRADCWARINNKKKRQPLKQGHHVIFDKPLSFTNGVHTNVFYIENSKRRLYKSPGGRYCRLNNRTLQNNPYQVVKFKGLPVEDLPILIGKSQAVDQEIQKRLKLFH